MGYVVRGVRNWLHNSQSSVTAYGRKQSAGCTYRYLGQLALTSFNTVRCLYGFIAPTHRPSTAPWGAMHRCRNRHAWYSPHVSYIQIAGPSLGSWPWDQRRSHSSHHTPTWTQPHPDDWRRVSPTSRHRPWGAGMAC